MRKFNYFFLFLLIIVSPVGCKSGLEKITLELWIADFNDETRQLLDETLIPAFERRYPKVKINTQYIAWGHLDEKLTISFAGGTSPDVFQVGAEYVGSLAYRGQAIVLDSLVREWNQQSDFYEAAWQTCVYKGKTYGIPYLSAPRALIFRKDMFRHVGLDNPPETWEELANYAAKLTVRDKAGIVRAGMNLPVSWQLFVEFLWENGGEIVDSTGTKALLDRPQAVEALQFYCDLYNKWKVCPTSGMPSVGGGVPTFAAGMAAMEINNQFSIYNVKKFAPDIKPNVGIASTPMRKRRIITVYTDWLAISPQSKQKVLAWELVKFLMEPDNLASYNSTLFFIPPRRSCKNAQFIKENPELEIFTELLEKYGRSLPPISQWFEIRAGLRTAVEQAIYGQKTPKRALEDYNKELNELLKEG